MSEASHMHDADLRSKYGEPDGYTAPGRAYWIIGEMTFYSPLLTPELAPRRGVKVVASRYSLSDVYGQMGHG